MTTPQPDLPLAPLRSEFANDPDMARNFLAEQVTNLSYTGSTQAEAIRAVLADPLH